MRDGSPNLVFRLLLLLLLVFVLRVSFSMLGDTGVLLVGGSCIPPLSLSLGFSPQHCCC